MNRQRNKGFTLAEMLVCMVILGIMLSLTVAGMTSWQDWANFKRENEYAQTLFIAAQNQLSEYVADGRIAELQDSLVGDADDDDIAIDSLRFDAVGLNLTPKVGSLIGENNAPYDLAEIFPESKGKANEKLYQDEIVSLRAETGDYRIYLNNPDGLKVSKPEAYWVFELLGSYVYDTTILNGGGNGAGASICVEITPANGQVFSVLYSDYSDKFVYCGVERDVHEDARTLDISNRTEKFREERMIGYYGVDTLYAATKNEMIQPEITGVKLHNKDTFYMTFKLSSKYAPLTSAMDYVMDLDSSPDVNDKKITITLPAKDSNGVANLKNKENAQRIMCPVTIYETDVDGKLQPVELGDFPVLAWVESDNSVHVVWDAADIQATTYLYEEELSDIRDANKAKDTKFAKTYSFFRFGVDPDNVYATVTAKSDGYTDSKPASNFGNLNPLRNQTAKHVCFAGEKDTASADGTDYIYTINNGRHLYNVRYIEDISYKKEAVSAASEAQIKSATFILKSNIDWKQFQENGELYSSISNFHLSDLNDKLQKADKTLIDKVNTKNCDFPSFSQLRSRDVFDGNKKTVTGVSVSEVSNALYGIYFGSDANSATLLETRPTSFININYGEIKDLSMDKIVASGSDMVGGICGINAGVVTNVKTLNTKDGSRITGHKNVGGIMGFLMPTREELTISKLENYAPVEGTLAVGGVLGMVRNEFSNVDITELTGLSDATKTLLSNPDSLNIVIDECKNYGAVAGLNSDELVGVYAAAGSSNSSGNSVGAGAKPADAGRYEARYIGGIVGYAYNQKENATEKIRIEQCVSSPQYSGETLDEILSNDKTLDDKLNGAYVGGIVGYNHFGQINDCSSKAPKNKEGYLFGYRYVGGVVGMNIGPSSGVLGSKTNSQGVNESHVIAYEYAGGITGCNANVMPVDSYGNEIVTRDPDKMEGLLVPAIERSMSVKVDNWVNRGIVIATNAYAGGITGYNSGWVYRCNSVVDATTADRYFAKLHSGDYAGGIAGYNNGVVGNTERDIETGKKNGANGNKFSTSCYVRGRNYVGGVVGYNDVDAIIEDYQIGSGYVIGDEGSHFVGGYAGLNSSIDLLMDVETGNARSITSNPNQVYGSYFVGGNVGGNILNTCGAKGGNPTTPPEASTKVDADKVYARFTRNNSYDNVLQMNLTVENHTDKLVTEWRVPFNEVWDIIDFQSQAYIYDATYNAVRAKEQWAGKVDANGTIGTSLSITFRTQEDRELFEDAYLNKQLEVIYFCPDDNKVGEYWGIASNPSDVTITKTSNNGYNQYSHTAFTYRIKNNTNVPMPNIRLEFDLPNPSGKCTADGYDVITKNDKIAVVAQQNYWTMVPANGQVSITLRVTFANEEEFNVFNAQSPILSFNNVAYTGNPAVTGGNIDSATAITSDIKAVFRTDNFLGTMKGTSYVGGFVGYNLMIDKEEPATYRLHPERRAVSQIQSRLIELFDASDKDASKSEDIKLLEKMLILNDVKKATGVDFDYSAKRINMTGEGSDMTTSAFGTITADVYAGGVLGYNDRNTKLYVQNVENSSAVVALRAIPNNQEQLNEDGSSRTKDYKGEDYTYTYSYAGGIIGYVSANTILDNCYNSYTGNVTTHGTYTGGLCEVNEGTLIHCSVSGFGSGVDDYLGGLCGLNKENGVITECNFKNKTVSGRNVIGGIASENFGLIDKIEIVKPRLNVMGIATGDKDGVTGIYAGFNGGTGIVKVENNLKDINIKSDGSYVGAIAGINAGTIMNLCATDAESTGTNLEISGNIEGYYDVGGVVGLNLDSNPEHALANYTNKATIIALNGNAGGIVGENASENNIKYCVNDAVVSATVGNAGGIVSFNTGVISHCYDYKSVYAPKGMCGGIVAINGSKKNSSATIKKCYVMKGAGFLSPQVVFESTQSIGGVAAWNYGVIQDNYLENITVTNKGTIPHTSIGVLVGDNLESGRIYLAGDNHKSIVDCSAIAITNNCNVGGVAGTNDGLIANKEAYENGGLTASGYALIGAEVKLKGASHASLGGVTGLNTGTIAYCQVDADITGDLGTETSGYGGIAGYSGYTSKTKYAEAKKKREEASSDPNYEYSVQIIGCTYDGTLHAEGSAGNPANVGGISGVNSYGSVIEDCAIGVRDKNLDGNPSLTTNVTAGDLTKTVAKPDEVSYAFIGGVTGRNYSVIRATDMEPKAVDTEINVISFGGSAAGIAGFNYAGAVVTGYLDDKGNEHWLSTPKSMKVEMRKGENDYGPGGIIGYNKSGEALSYVRNYAHVENYVDGNVKTGGLIGTLEQKLVPYVEFNHCENYGKVEGIKQIGGMIGRTKFCSVRMTDCANYGEVYASAGTAAGFISRVYDIVDFEMYFTGCDNHGYIHTANKTGTDYSTGGFIANFANNTNTKIYFYDCDNTGCVEKDGTKSINANYNTGSFVGNGNSITMYFDNCQNYNTAPSANGFVGYQGIVKLRNCLDNSGTPTDNETFSPFIGAYCTNGSGSDPGTANTKSNVSNSYYIDKSSAGDKSFAEHAGAYFTFNPSQDANNNSYKYYWQGNSYSVMRNPALWLTTPSAMSSKQMARNSRFQMHVEYDKTKCIGLSSLNLYLWTGDFKTQPTAKTVGYTFTAIFTDADGNKATTTETVSTVVNKFGDSCVRFTVPTGLSSEIKDFELYAVSSANCNIYMRGFTYNPITPSGAGEEAVMDYIADHYDTAFKLDIKSGSTVRKAPQEFKNPQHATNYSATNPEDILGLEFGKYEFFRYDRANGAPLDFDFDVSNGENASGMKAFVFYPANNNTSSGTAAGNIRTYYYDYEVTFTDKNGKSATVTGSRAEGTAAVGKDSAAADFKQGVAVEVPADLDKVITHVKLSFTGSAYTQIDTKTMTEKAAVVNQNNYYLRGFGWIPAGQTQVSYMGYGDRPAIGAYTLEGNAYIEKLCVDSTEKGTSDVPYVYPQSNYTGGFNMTANNPVADVYYNDKDSYEISDGKADGSDSRIKVYKDLHPKFVNLLLDEYTRKEKLATPEPKVTSTSNGRYTVAWSAVPNAYEYEVKYEIKDESGKIVEKSEIIRQGVSNKGFLLPIQGEWTGCTAIFYVRAVNAYRYGGNDAVNAFRYDSDWGSTEAGVKKVLPQPEIHMELTAGNKMAAVLDNREAYRLADGSYMDCVINVTYDKDNYVIHVADSFVSEKAVYTSGHNITTDYYLSAKAVPTAATSDVYTESQLVKLAGHAVDNKTLETTPQYTTTNFRGFYGDQADQMVYNIYFTASSRDCYIKSDAIAYDEQLGLDISYAYMRTHVAAVYKGVNFTATLSNLPMEWFAEDYVNPIIVREYLDYSQYDMVRYGHTVAENVYLDKETPEENQAILAQITDPYYLSAEDGTELLLKDVSIWDETTGSLKSGYTLQLKYDEDGQRVFDIFYNASIELAKRAAQEKNAALTGEARYIYYNHCVDYKLYTARDGDITLADAGSNHFSGTKKAAEVNSDDYQETYLVRNYIDKTQTAESLPATNTNVKVQELQPAPIIDSFKEGVTGGHRSFTFTFDEYYKDVYCMTLNNTKKSNTWYTNNGAQYLTNADASVATTWAAFMEKSGYAALTDNARKMRVMNAYYYTYLGAKYRVDLIGKILDGEEAVIATTDVDTPTRLPDMTNTYNAGGKDITATYERYNYAATFTDTEEIWNNYSDFTIRVMRLGRKDSLTYNMNVPNITKFQSYQGSTFILPRYSEYNIHILMKLNTINNPSASLHKEGKDFVTDDLLYDVNFGAITNSNQKKDLGGYLIRARLKEAADSNKTAQTHYYYVTEIDASAAPDTIGSTISDLIAAGSLVTEINPETEYVKNGNSRTAIIDLSDFNTDDVVEISVQAIARSGAVNYQDGDIGSTTEVKILERLDVPIMENLKLDTTQGMDDASNTEFVDMETYNKGFFFTYDSNYTDSGMENVRLNMAVALYDSAGDAADVAQHMAGDSVAGAWNEGAVTTLYMKKSALDMGRVNDGKVTQLDLVELEEYAGQFAGKWLKIALKASSTTKIDSQWTDMDASAENTVNYKWIQIPKLNLPDVDLREDDGSDESTLHNVIRYFFEGNIYDEIPSGTDLEHTRQIASKTLWFTEQRNQTGYEIILVGKAKMVDGVSVTPVYRIYMERHGDEATGRFDGTWDVFIAAGNSNTDISKAVAAKEQMEAALPVGKTLPACVNNPAAVYVDNIGVLLPNMENPNEPRTYDNMVTFEDIADTFGTKYSTWAELRYIQGENGADFALVLPDIASIGETSYENNSDYFTICDVIVKPFMADYATNYKAGNAGRYVRTYTPASGANPEKWETSIAIMNAEELESWKTANAELLGQ